ncbi:MAG: AAA family ATPase, partial [Cyanobacteria bacterium P01_F01_bin.153]
MYLKQLQLKQFRNYSEQTVDFRAPKTILVGDNAQGKSNVLEAIELLATLNSHRTHRDRELVQWGQAIAECLHQNGGDSHWARNYLEARCPACGMERDGSVQAIA